MRTSFAALALISLATASEGALLRAKAAEVDVAGLQADVASKIDETVSKWDADSASWKEESDQGMEEHNLLTEAAQSARAGIAAENAVSEKIELDEEAARQRAATLEAKQKKLQEASDIQPELELQAQLRQSIERLTADRKSVEEDLYLASKSVATIAEQAFRIAEKQKSCTLVTKMMLKASAFKMKREVDASRKKLAKATKQRKELANRRAAIQKTERDLMKSQEKLSVIGELKKAAGGVLSWMGRQMKFMSFLEVEKFDVAAICGTPDQLPRFPAVAEAICEFGDVDIPTPETITSRVDGVVSDLDTLDEAHTAVAEMIQAGHDVVANMRAQVLSAGEMKAKIAEYNRLKREALEKEEAGLQTLKHALEKEIANRRVQQRRLAEQTAELRKQEAKADDFVRGMKIKLRELRNEQKQKAAEIQKGCILTGDPSLVRYAEEFERQYKHLGQDQENAAKEQRTEKALGDKFESDAEERTEYAWEAESTVSAQEKEVERAMPE